MAGQRLNPDRGRSGVVHAARPRTEYYYWPQGTAAGVERARVDVRQRTLPDQMVHEVWSSIGKLLLASRAPGELDR